MAQHSGAQSSPNLGSTVTVGTAVTYRSTGLRGTVTAVVQGSEFNPGVWVHVTYVDGFEAWNLAESLEVAR